MSSPLSALFRPQAPTLAASIALSSAAGLMELGPAVGVYLLARLAFADDPSSEPWTVTAVVALVAATVVLRFFLVGGSLILSHKVAFRLMRQMRMRMAEGLGRAPLSFFDASSRGDLKKAMVEDVDGLENAFAHHVPEGGSAVVVPVVAFCILLFVDWRLALASVALVPVGFVLMSTTMRNFDELMSDWHAAERKANDAILDFLRGIVVLKSFGRSASSMVALRAGVEGIRDRADAMNRRSAPSYTAFMLLLSSNLVVVLPVGLWMLQHQHIGRPELMLYLALGYGITAPMLKLLFLFGDIQMNGVRLKRIRAVLDAGGEVGAPGLADDSVDMLASKSPLGLRVEGVSFAYSAERGEVLHDVTCDVPAGRLVALVGPSGAGKTTLAQLLSGERLPDTGRIIIYNDSQDVVDVALHDVVGTVGQQAQLFFGTLRDNLLLARRTADDADLDAAVQAAGLTEVVARLPRGLDTPLGDRGAHLSGGEMQRVTIARALLQNRPIMVLDEVTSHLDPENERAVQQGMLALAQHRTVIFVAHRLQTAMHADRIWVMEGGRIVSSGRHDELMVSSTTYRRMWEAQSQAAGWTLEPGEPVRSSQKDAS